MSSPIGGNELNMILLSAINVIKQISNVELTKKHIFSSHESLTINADLLLIKLSGDITGDILIKFDNNLKKIVLEKFLNNYSEIKDSKNTELENSAFNEIGNLISAKMTNFLSVENKKVDISSVSFIPSKEEIFYESIFAINMTSDFGDLSIYLCLNEIKYERSISFIFYGFSEDSMEEIINDFIPKGFEVYYAQNSTEFLNQIKSKKFDIAVIDFYVVYQDFNIFLKSYFSSLDYKINLIFGVTKLDTIKFQGISANSDKYQIIGLFLKTFSIKEIVKYIYSILQKIGIRANDRRKHVRVILSDNTRYFVTVDEKNYKFTAKLLDISMGGFKAQIDITKEKDKNENKVIKKIPEISSLLNNVDMFLKYNRLKVSCKVVYSNDKCFSVSFINLTEQDKNTLANVIFKILCNK